MLFYSFRIGSYNLSFFHALAILVISFHFNSFLKSTNLLCHILICLSMVVKRHQAMRRDCQTTRKNYLMNRGEQSKNVLALSRNSEQVTSQNLRQHCYSSKPSLTTTQMMKSSYPPMNPTLTCAKTL